MCPPPPVQFDTQLEVTSGLSFARINNDIVHQIDKINNTTYEYTYNRPYALPSNNASYSDTYSFLIQNHTSNDQEVSLWFENSGSYTNFYYWLQGGSYFPNNPTMVNVFANNNLNVALFVRYLSPGAITTISSAVIIKAWFTSTGTQPGANAITLTGRATLSWTT